MIDSDDEKFDETLTDRNFHIESEEKNESEER
jgi:hypothetical protein